MERTEILHRMSRRNLMMLPQHVLEQLDSIITDHEQNERISAEARHAQRQILADEALNRFCADICGTPLEKWNVIGSEWRRRIQTEAGLRRFAIVFGYKSVKIIRVLTNSKPYQPQEFRKAV